LTTTPHTLKVFISNCLVEITLRTLLEVNRIFILQVQRQRLLQKLKCSVLWSCQMTVS
jgi:hypothetical protein